MLLWFFFSSDIIFLSCIFKKTSLLTCLHIDSFWFVCFAYLFIYSCTILVIHYYSQTLPKNQNGWCYMDDHIISLLISRFPLSTAAPASAVRNFFPFFSTPLPLLVLTFSRHDPKKEINSTLHISNNLIPHAVQVDWTFEWKLNIIWAFLFFLVRLSQWGFKQRQSVLQYIWARY